ncbi:PhoPQ-activated pathogenicity-related family protein [Echinicola salinicaeni]|uniref:PhoPQ-activated pathogenicity-related family protein n=1 Tax=Echinicola salinicaeni TaxID=2762757 RepID=UPI0016494750|nr:PhoPQ-activated protein PqaA family protein [Echinicola salinicaeni]
MNTKPLKFTLVILISCLSFLSFAQESNHALEKYLETPSPDFQFEVLHKLKKGQLTQYELLLTSQRWKGYTWKHRLVILAPKHIEHDQVLLYIGGGRLKNGLPQKRKRDDDVVQGLEKLALQNKAIVGAIFQVPNQPIFDGRVEDEIISYTLHQYQETGDETWPLLFPMIKSVQKAMDAIEEFSTEKLQISPQHFLLTGLSKRGWTTWLTGSQDPRVNAIAPMVIDVLNMPVSLQYQIAMWQDYSPEIQDYVDLGIPQQSNTPAGKATIAMVDPYSYKQLLTMPKLVFMGTNDPYWPIDAAKNYWKEIPGDNDLVYIPNVEHGLGDGKIALQNLNAFFEYQCLQQALPEVNMEVSHSNSNYINIKASFSGIRPDRIEIWEAASEEDMDFRDEKWTSSNFQGPSQKVALPKVGQKALYLAYHFTSPNGKPYYLSSKIIRINTDGIVH